MNFLKKILLLTALIIAPTYGILAMQSAEMEAVIAEMVAIGMSREDALLIAQDYKDEYEQARTPSPAQSASPTSPSAIMQEEAIPDFVFPAHMNSTLDAFEIRFNQDLAQLKKNPSNNAVKIEFMEFLRTTKAAENYLSTCHSAMLFGKPGERVESPTQALLIQEMVEGQEPVDCGWHSMKNVTRLIQRFLKGRGKEVEAFGEKPEAAEMFNRMIAENIQEFWDGSYTHNINRYPEISPLMIIDGSFLPMGDALYEYVDMDEPSAAFLNTIAKKLQEKKTRRQPILIPMIFNTSSAAILQKVSREFNDFLQTLPDYEKFDQMNRTITEQNNPKPMAKRLPYRTAKQHFKKQDLIKGPQDPATYLAHWFVLVLIQDENGKREYTVMDSYGKFLDPNTKEYVFNPCRIFKNDMVVHFIHEIETRMAQLAVEATPAPTVQRRDNGKGKAPMSVTTTQGPTRKELQEKEDALVREAMRRSRESSSGAAAASAVNPSTQKQGGSLLRSLESMLRPSSTLRLNPFFPENKTTVAPKPGSAVDEISSSSSDEEVDPELAAAIALSLEKA